MIDILLGFSGLAQRSNQLGLALPSASGRKLSLSPHDHMGPDESSRQEKWLAVNNPQNCKFMDSLSHRLHNNRLLAIHPANTIYSMFGIVFNFMKVTHRVRFFAPIFSLIQRNHAIGFLPIIGRPWITSLKWHYEATVVENMWAVFLLNDGGSKGFA